MTTRNMRTGRAGGVARRAAGASLAALCLVVGGLAVAEPANAATSPVSAQAAEAEFTVNGPVAFNIGETTVIGGHGVPGASIFISFTSAETDPARTTVKADGTWTMSFILGPEEYNGGAALVQQRVPGEAGGEIHFVDFIVNQPSPDLTVDDNGGVKVIPAGGSTTITGSALPYSTLRIRLADDRGTLVAPVLVDRDGRWSATIRDPGTGVRLYVEYLTGETGYTSFDLLRVG